MISLMNISFSYGKEVVFDDFSLDIPSRITVLEGASGCGKTTLLKIIAGLLKPSHGTAEGLPKKPAFMFQEDRLLPWLSVTENIATVQPQKNVEKTYDILKQLRLFEFKDKFPTELSGGQCRRVAMGRNLAYEGDMLILDEPLKGLDPELAAHAVQVIKSYDLPILVTSHSKFETDLWEGMLIKL